MSAVILAGAVGAALLASQRGAPAAEGSAPERGPIVPPSPTKAPKKAKPCEPADTWFREVALPAAASKGGPEGAAAAESEWNKLSCGEKKEVALLGPIGVQWILLKKNSAQIRKALDDAKKQAEKGLGSVNKTIKSTAKKLGF